LPAGSSSLFAAASARLLPVTFVAACLGCQPPPAADNVLFVSFDTTRADRLSVYGHEQPTSPALEALAARGVVFERAFTHAPSTLPAHGSMMTGLLPPSHGVRCNGKFAIPEEDDTLAEILGRRGFATAAIIGAFPLDARFGLAQGFDVYDDDFSTSARTAAKRRGRMDTPGFWIGHDYLDFERGADEVTDRALAWLDERRRDSRRWFLFAHYFDPHWPYEPDAAWGDRFEHAYDAEIAYTDEQLGRLLDAVAGMPGRTLVVFTSDHGEGLGDHGEELHNRYLYNSTLHVPLIMALDGTIEPGRRIGAVTGHVDIMPTVLDLVGVGAAPGSAGRSLLAAVSGRGEPAPRPLYSETLVWSLERPMGIEVRSLIEGSYKLVETRLKPPQAERTRLELYDLSSDMGELVDRAAFDGALVSEMAGRLGRWSQSLDAGAYTPEPVALDEGARARLKALGYL